MQDIHIYMQDTRTLRYTLPWRGILSLFIKGSKLAPSIGFFDVLGISCKCLFTFIENLLIYNEACTCVHLVQLFMSMYRLRPIYMIAGTYKFLMIGNTPVTHAPGSQRHSDRTATKKLNHCNDVIMGAIASLITSLTIVYSTVYSDADQRKHQSSASLVPGEFPTQMASNAENVSIWWRHHDSSHTAAMSLCILSAFAFVDVVLHGWTFAVHSHASQLCSDFLLSKCIRIIAYVLQWCSDSTATVQCESTAKAVHKHCDRRRIHREKWFSISLSHASV